MSSDLGRTLNRLQDWSQIVAIAVLATTASAAVAASVLAGFGLLPWASLTVLYGETTVDIGPFVQVGIAVFLTLLCAFFPSARRVLRLEVMHRNFSLSMEDVTRAYWAAHAADREGTFTLGREFDAVRERLMFLRDHPDLADLEPAVLEIAAQMGTESRELARIYSDENVKRAKEMLEHRRAEAETLTERVAAAHGATTELRRMLADVEMDEEIVRSRIERLREELADLMPAIESPASDLPALRRSMIGVVPGE